LDDKYRICYDIVCDLVGKSISTTLYEPMTSFTTITKAKMKVKNPTSSKVLKDNYMSPVDLKKDPSAGLQNAKDGGGTLSARERGEAIANNKSPERKQEKKRVLQIENKPILSLTLKTEVAKAPYNERPLFQDVAEVLQEMIEVLEEGKTALPKRIQGNIVNKALEDKMKLKDIENKEKEDFEKRRKLRAQVVTKQITEQKKNRGTTKDMKKQEDAKKSEKETEKEKKKEEKRVVLTKELKEQTKVYQEKKKVEKETKKKGEVDKKKEETEAKKKQFEEFNEDKKKKYTEKFTNIKNKRDQDEKEKKDKGEKDKKDMEELKRKMKILLLADRKKKRTRQKK